MARSRRRSPVAAASLGLPLLVAIGWWAWEATAEVEPGPARLHVRPLTVHPAFMPALEPPAVTIAQASRPAPDAAEPPPAAAVPAVGEPLERRAPIADTGNVAPEPRSYSSPASRSQLPANRVRRRDPLEPPLLERDAWQELVLAVTLNGERLSEGSLFARSPADGALYVELAAAQAWRLRTDPLRIVTLQGQPYYPLAALPEVDVVLDEPGLGVTIDVAATAFLPFDLAQRGPTAPAPRAGTGGFIDYDLLLDAGERIERRLDGLVEVGAFAPAGVITTGLRLSDLAEAAEIVRLDTTFTRDLPERRSSIRVGDSLTTGGAFARSIRFVGLQYSSNFATDPEFVTFPLPVIGGLAEQSSVVDVLVDNLQRSQGDVPAGPFSLGELPVVTGAGEVQLRVTDLLGRERLTTQSYYVSSRLLKPGLHDFAYELGLERDDYGTRSFAYTEPLATATHRYGWTDALTSEMHAELQPDLAGLVAGGSALLGNSGVVSLGAGGSLAQDGAGMMGELGYEYDGRTFSAGARTRLESAAFTQVGYDGGSRRTDQLNLGVDLGEGGQVGLLLLNRDAYDEGDFTSVAASWGLNVGAGALSLRAAQVVEPDPELAVTATYSMALGATRSIATDVERRDGEHQARLQYRQTRGASDIGLDYRLGADVGEDASAVDARLSYQAAVGAGDLEVEHRDGATAARLGASGSVAMLDGHIEATRRIGRAFGLVDLPGFPNVRVYLDNREAGRTDDEGRLILPGLRPFESNRVEIEVEDLPLDAQVASTETTVVPFDRGGVRVDLTVDRRRQATVTLMSSERRPLPAGLVLVSEDGATTATVGRGGFALLDGLGDAGREVAGEAAGTRYRCELPALPPSDPLPDLGELSCAG